MKSDREVLEALHTLRSRLDSARLYGREDTRIEVHFHGASLFPLYRIRVHHPSRADASVDLACKKIKNPDMAKKEAEGLSLLSEHGSATPYVYGVIDLKNHSFLFMEWLSEERSNNRDGLIFMLSRQYAKEFETYGFDRDNYIGNLTQVNHTHSTFESFWLEDRILPLLKTKKGRQLIDERLANKIVDTTRKCIEDWNLNEIKPRLVHGDLWSGNLLFCNDQPYLIDPSIAYSNPEQDLAMLHLFGSPLSFDQFDTILENAGLPGGIAERIPFWQIYPLLVHVNIFGSSYVRSLEKTIHFYSKS